MSDIQRWRLCDPSWGLDRPPINTVVMVESNHGEWVSHAAHLAEKAKLEAEIAALRQQLADKQAKAIWVPVDEEHLPKAGEVVFVIGGQAWVVGMVWDCRDWKPGEKVYKIAPPKEAL